MPYRAVANPTPTEPRACHHTGALVGCSQTTSPAYDVRATIAGVSGDDESKTISRRIPGRADTQRDCIACNYLRLALRVWGLRSGNP